LLQVLHSGHTAFGQMPIGKPEAVFTDISYPRSGIEAGKTIQTSWPANMPVVIF